MVNLLHLRFLITPLFCKIQHPWVFNMINRVFIFSSMFQVESIVRQRDMYRVLLQQAGPQVSSDNGQFMDLDMYRCFNEVVCRIVNRGQLSSIENKSSIKILYVADYLTKTANLV